MASSVKRLIAGQAFEISRTPPEEKNRRAREAAEAAMNELAFLVLTPFCQIPRVEFDGVRLGKTAVRKCVVQNPGKKPIKVSLDPLPKADRGFEVDYTGFILPGGHEATLCIGWAPGRAGNVREKIGVKYGSCRTQIVLAGGCEAPKEKRTTVVPAPSFAQKRAPLRSSNRVKQAGGISGKKGESMPAKASEAQIPKNPVEKAEGQPTFAPMRSSPDNAENVPPKVAMMTAKALKVPQVPDISWSPQVVQQKKSVESCFVSQKTSSHQEIQNQDGQKYDNFFAVPPPHLGANFATLGATHPDLRRETFIMDDPSFISSTPSAAKMSHLLPADVSVIPNAGIHIDYQRRPSSKELFGPATVVVKEHEEPFLRRETYIAQSLARVEVQSPQLVKLTDNEVSNMLNFSDGSVCGSALSKDSEQIFARVFNVSKSEEEVVGNEEEEVENASLLVKNYMENSDKERSSAMGNTLTNSQKTNSTGEVTAIQTIVMSPKDGMMLSDLTQKTSSHQEIQNQDQQKYGNLFAMPPPHLVATSATSHPDLCQETFIMDNLSLVSSTPSMAKISHPAPADVSVIPNSGIHIDDQRRPSSIELFGPVAIVVEEHEETFLHRETYITQTLAPIDEEEVENASLLVKNYMENSDKEGLLMRDIVEHSEKERMSASRETYTVENETSEDSEQIISEVFNVTKNVSKAEEENVGNEEGEVKNASLLVKNYMQNSYKESLLIGNMVETSEKDRMSTSRETYTVEDATRKDSEQIITEVFSVTKHDSKAEKEVIVNEEGEIKNATLLEKNDMGNSDKEMDKCKPPKSRSGGEKTPRVVEKYNGSAATSAALNVTKTKKTTTSNVRQSVGGIGLLKKSTKAKRASAGPQHRLTLIKPMRGSVAGKVASHPNPFASRNIYYDERWVQKQESGFMKWLNFILTPDSMSDDEESTLAPGKIDVAKLWRACSSNVRVPRAPTREALSLRAYTARREMNRLRRHACTLWQTPGVAQVITRVEIEIEKKGLMIRKDRSINKDVGMKKGFLELLLSYNPLWLKIGLETVYGEVLSFARGVDDIVGMSQFIVTRMLSNPDILSQFAHPTVPHHYSPGCGEALKQFTLKKFMQVVYFLDQAKMHGIIKHNPCLFHKDSKTKQSKDLVLAFSRDFLAGEGDIIKHLAYLGFNLTHKQTILDEYDYAVTNLAVDLKDGVRLCRVMEFLMPGSQRLSDKLRMPAGSRLQKLHNVDTALGALRISEAGLPKSITAKDVVDGHLEKTLALMWHVIFGFQLDRILDEERLRSEVDHLRKSLRYRAQIKDPKALAGSHFVLECNQRELVEETNATAGRVQDVENDWANSQKMKLLLKWVRLVCAHYGVEIENLTVSFSDGRALCFLLHHYYPSFLRREDISGHTTVAASQSGAGAQPSNLDCSLDDSFGAMTYSYGQNPKLYEQMLSNEKKNFKIFHEKASELGGVPMLIRSADMSNTIPDQKITAIFLTYLAARLLDLSAEMTAARTIQLFWRRYSANKREKEFKAATEAAILIQRRFRRFRHARLVMKYTDATIVLQRVFRRYLERRGLYYEIHKRIRTKKLSEAAVSLQKHWRRYVAQREFRIVSKATLIIQKNWRVHRKRAELNLMMGAATLIQKNWRMLSEQKRYNNMIKAATLMQATWRGYQHKREFQELKSACIIIQCSVRQHIAKKHLKQLGEERCGALMIQKSWRGLQQRKKYQHLRNSVITLQIFIRQQQARKYLEALRKEKIKCEHDAALVIQKTWRMQREKACFNQKIKSILKIQAFWRGFQQRRKFQSLKKASIRIQTLVRQYNAKTKLKHLRKESCAALIIQKYWRGLIQFKQYQHLRSSVIRIQCLVRQYFAKKYLYHLKQQKTEREIWASTLIQKNWRMHLEQIRYNTMIKTATLIQATWRGYQQKRVFQELKSACIIIQCSVRQNIAKKHLKQLREERCGALMIQKSWRGLQKRKKYQHLRNSVITLQSFIRQQQARKYLEALRTEKIKCEHDAALVLQKTWRMQREKACFNQKIKSILKIQAFWRGFQQRRKYQSLKKASIRIQTLVRQYNAKAKLKQLRKESCAALSIQKHWKGLIQLRKYQHLRSSAIIIQCIFRQHLAKKYLYHLKQQKTEREIRASTIIQKNWRMHSKQKRYNTMIKTATLIQATWRGYQQKRELQELKSACIIIQCSVRQHIAKTLLKQLREERCGALMIQKSWRGLQQRRKYQHLRNSIITLQCFVRQQQARKCLERLRQEKIECKNNAALVIQKTWRMQREKACFNQKVISILKIQACWRGFQQRKKYEGLKKACTTIQPMVRQYIAKTKLKQLRKENNAVLIIQKHWKGVKQFKKYELMRASAIRIQCFFRQYFARNYLDLLKQQKLEKEILATIIIQKNWRMHREQKGYNSKLKAAIMIQATWRGYQQKREFQELKGASIIIQCSVRQYIAKKHLKQLREERCGALMIQKSWRGLQQRKKYQHLRNSVITLQSFIRQQQARKYLEGLRNEKIECEHNAALVLQKTWRMQREKACFNHKIKSILKVQACWRGFQQRRKYLSLRKASIIIQTLVRQYNAKSKLKQLRKENYAALIIQKCWKGLIQLRKFVHLRNSAIIIQSLARQYFARKYSCHLKQQKIEKEILAAIIIQKNWRMHKEQKGYNTKLKAGTLIQANWRGFQERIKFKEWNHACIVIQTAVRQYITRIKDKRHARKIFAALIIQKVWRGLKQRRIYEHMRKNMENNAAITIQKYWRGHVVRQGFRLAAHQPIVSQVNPPPALQVVEVTVSEELGKRIEEVREKVKKANENVTEDKKLGNRTDFALDYLYCFRDMGQLIQAVQDLDISTRLSSVCCDRLISEGPRCLLVLLDLIQRCNRSVPHMVVVSSSLDILINLAKYDKARSVMCEASSAIKVATTITDLVVIYRDKSSEIFTKGCSILWTLTVTAQSFKKVLHSSVIEKKLSDVHCFHLKKHQRHEEDERVKRRAATSTKKASKSRPPKVRLSSNAAWRIREGMLRHYSDPYTAVADLMKAMTEN